MFDIFKNRLEITGTLITVTALRISQGRSNEPIGSDLPVVKDALGQPLIPGSSFKGAMRSRLESFLRGIAPRLARDPSELTSPHLNDEVKRLKEVHADNDAALTDALAHLTDAASSLFGAPWQASKFQVRDLTVDPDTWFGQYQERDGVSIERDTETAADGRLYDFQVVPAGTSFDFKAIVENAEDWELGLLMVGLHQFETEQIPLGGGCSRGLGVVRLEGTALRWVDVRSPDGTPDPDQVRDYMRRLVTQPDAALEDAAQCRQRWANAFIDQLPSLIQRSSGAGQSAETPS
ncbi:MAG: CRISPR-associated RAMP protein [Leptolyngbya sp. SIO4C1]|nr:CRISPR-associated RAMP protein [Leptolyngbya sp. SIO4C1]